MSGKWGGGGTKCTICTKTVYPAETIQLEKKPYHIECFACSVCEKKMEGPAKAQLFEDTLYCHPCFKKGGFAQKQKKIVWTKKESTGSAVTSKFGGGGVKCTICDKTVYAAETVQYEKKPYHSECFKFIKCDTKTVPSKAAQFEGDLYCLKCFKDGGYSRKQTKTSGSGNGGEAKPANAMASKFGGGGVKCNICTKTVYSAEQVSFDKVPYHSECFKCTTCEKQMTPSGAAKYEESIYCTKCFNDGGYRQKQAKVTHKSTGGSTSAKFSKFGGGGNKCVRCVKTVYPAETVSFEKNFFHSACFSCMECDKQLTPSNAEGKKLEDGGVDTYCKKCWGEKGLNRAQLNPTKPAE